jgi:hypothetical protein
VRWWWTQELYAAVVGLATHARAGAARDALRLPPAPTTRDEADDDAGGHARPRVCATSQPAVDACSVQRMPCERRVSGYLEQAMVGDRSTASTWWVSAAMGVLAVGWWWWWSDLKTEGRAGRE